MRTNSVAKFTGVTHEGSPAHAINKEQELRRSVMACLLWEGEFYESGVQIATRIKDLVGQVKPETVYNIAVEARHKQKLRHVPLLLARELLRQLQVYGPHQNKASMWAENAVRDVIQRADEPAELLSMLFKDGKEGVVPHAARRGITEALRQFDEYQLGKYKGEQNEVKLRDVFRIVHPKPNTPEQKELWRKAVKGELATPDTWEVALSGSKGQGKKEEWERLIAENKMGGLAVLRNLRNMQQAGVYGETIAQAIEQANYRWVLPFRFIAAARAASDFEPQLEAALFRSVADKAKLPGKTVLLIDTSPSMAVPLSQKSDLTRMDAAFGAAAVARELCVSAESWAFSSQVAKVPPRRGFALMDAFRHAVPSNGTLLGNALKTLERETSWDRLIVITDEQSQDEVGSAPGDKNYLINVASNRNGVGYGAWTHIDGFSEGVFTYIQEAEREGSNVVSD